MKQSEFSGKLPLLLAPLVLILLGLVLAVNPDSASALIAKCIGWGMAFAGACCGFAALASPRGRAGKVFAAIALAAAGGWLVKNPLALAAWIGRFIGILLLINGVSDFGAARRVGMRPGFSLISALLGILLIVLPMTASRLLFRLVGLVVTGVGVAMLISRLRDNPRLNEPEDPNIIDAL